MSLKERSPLYHGEQEMIDGYHDDKPGNPMDQWHLVLDPLYKKFQAWKAGHGVSRHGFHPGVGIRTDRPAWVLARWHGFPGHRILIHGGGGSIGTAMLQLGKLLDLEMYGSSDLPLEQLGSKGSQTVRFLKWTPHPVTHIIVPCQNSNL